MLLNRIIDQTAVNLNLDYLAVLPLMPVALLFLIVRFIGVSLGLNLKRFSFHLFCLFLALFLIISAVNRIFRLHVCCFVELAALTLEKRLRPSLHALYC